MITCPKCGAGAGGAACPKCGLVFAKFDASVLDESSPADLIELWDDLACNWDERGRHAFFLERPLMLGQTGFAAQRYRTKGEDGAAAEQLARLQKRLEQDFKVHRKPRRPSTGVMRLISWTVIVLALAAAMYFLFRLKSGAIRTIVLIANTPASR